MESAGAVGAGAAGARATPVQELAGALGMPDVPTQYVVPAHNDQQLAAAVTASVPVIDLGRLLKKDGAGADELVKLRSGLDSWGLILVSNHGVDAAVMDGMRAASREFFRRPLEEKQKYTNLIGGKKFQFEGYGNDRVNSPDQILDWTDRIYLKVEPEDERRISLWPAHPKTFRDALHEFTKKCGNVKEGVLRAMANLLDLDDNYFVEQLGEKPLTHARCSYYPECPMPELVFGLKPHTDGTVVTVLMVDDTIGGLQVLRDGVWWDVPVVPHTLVVIIGDQIQIMSNGIFKSPVHRVVTNAKKERISVALDYSVDPMREIEPSAHLVNEKRPALYRKVKVKDYIAVHYNHFSHGEMFIDSFKI